MPKRKTHQQIIVEFKAIHGNAYDYSNVSYTGDGNKVEIICEQHGPFFQTPNNHKRGQKCPKCKIERQIARNHKNLLSTDVFIENAMQTHGNKYSYTNTTYINQATKVSIICPAHGNFNQLPGNHTQGQGCPKCSNSKGELKIRNILQQLNIVFVEQKRFNKCRNKRALPFDFFIPSQNTLIEFDGKQHFDSGCKYNQGTDNLQRIQHNDKIKTKFAQNNNFKLIRIPYTQINNITTILQEQLT